MLKLFLNRLCSVPAAYDFLQGIAGRARFAAIIARIIETVPHGRTLDVGSSGGVMAKELGRSAVSVDLDPAPIFKSRSRGNTMASVVGDAGALPFVNGSFDVTLLIAVSHHLDDATLRATLAELARVTRGSFVFVDGLLNNRRWLARLLWRYDRGRFPRGFAVQLRIRRAGNDLGLAWERDFLTAEFEGSPYHDFLRFRRHEVVEREAHDPDADRFRNGAITLAAAERRPHG